MADFFVFSSEEDGDYVVGQSLYLLQEDAEPALFWFSPRYHTALSVGILSNPQIITDINVGVPFTVTNGTLVVNGVNQGNSGVLEEGDVVQLSLTTSGSVSTAVTAVLTIAEEYVYDFTAVTAPTPQDLGTYGNWTINDIMYGRLKAGDNILL